MPVELIFYIATVILLLPFGLDSLKLNIVLFSIGLTLAVWIGLAHNYRDPTVLRQEKRVEHIQNLSYINFDGKQIVLPEEYNDVDKVEVTWTKPCTVFGIAFHQGEYNFKGIE